MRVPNVIFMHIALPGMDGLHATMLIRELEKMNRGEHVPIIVLTRHGD
ncbi:MAG: hypothetical protein K2Y22_16105 [Candidatus Obscuribacterales bacterium]|nr:hypothetical protein [Candidatus Obscuribacterales bacterium]